MLTGVKLVFRSPYLLGICLYIWLYTTLSTFLYFEQAHIVADAFAESGKRTTLFAYVDLAVNMLTVLGQLFLTARTVARFGLAVALALVPAIVALGFLTLGLFPVLAVLVCFQVLRRAGNYAIAKPAREILFTVVGREEKYKSKNFIDTVVYRGGDAVSGWAYAGLAGVGLGLSGIAFVAVPVAVAWLFTGLGLGKEQEKRRWDASYQVPPVRTAST
jgi:AAA family ATP:ADP antiporter